jgi:hypothetical protein
MRAWSTVQARLQTGLLALGALAASSYARVATFLVTCLSNSGKSGRMSLRLVAQETDSLVQFTRRVEQVVTNHFTKCLVQQILNRGPSSVRRRYNVRVLRWRAGNASSRYSARQSGCHRKIHQAAPRTTANAIPKMTHPALSSGMRSQSFSPLIVNTQVYAVAFATARRIRTRHASTEAVAPRAR